MFTKSNNLIAQLRNDPLTQFVLWIIFFFISPLRIGDSHVEITLGEQGKIL